VKHFINIYIQIYIYPYIYTHTVYIYLYKLYIVYIYIVCERVYAGLYFERHSFKKHINYLKLGVNEHVNINTFS